MSHEAVPETRRQNPQAGPAAPEQVPAQDGGAPKGLLQQMEELMAALNADLSQLDADLQSSTERTPSSTAPAPGDMTAPGSTTRTSPAPGSDNPSPRSA
ncbi:hypothetical protein [Streptomyces sp. NPDC054838]